MPTARFRQELPQATMAPVQAWLLFLSCLWVMPQLVAANDPVTHCTPGDLETSCVRCVVYEAPLTSMMAAGLTGLHGQRSVWLL